MGAYCIGSLEHKDIGAQDHRFIGHMGVIGSQGNRFIGSQSSWVHMGHKVHWFIGSQGP